MAQQSRREITTARRVFDIIDVLHQSGTASVSDVADDVGLAKSTTHEYLRTLVDLGFVKRGDSGYYLGLTLLKYGGLARRRRPVYEESMPEIDRLATELTDRVNERGLTAHLAVLEGIDLVLVAFEKTDWNISTGNFAGGGVNVHSSELAKAVLPFADEDTRDTMISNAEFDAFTDHTITDERALEAELDRVREAGYAVNDEEEYDHIKGIGCPIRFEDDVLGSISVSGPKSGIEQEEDLVLELLRTSVENIELRLEHR